MKTMKRFLSIAAFFAALILTFSCDREGTLSGETSGDGATLSVAFATEAPTRASDTASLPGETKLNSVEVLIYRVPVDPTLPYRLEARRKANGAEISAGLLRMETSPGVKHVYAVANAPAGSLDGATTEADLKAVFTRFVDNAPEGFVMAGSPGRETELVAGAKGNEVSIELRRVAARVKVEKVRAEFTSRAVRESDLRILRVYLTYIPKRVKLVNGDCIDVFGTAHEATLDGKQYAGYYDYAVPVPGDDRMGRSDDGFVNPGVLVDGKVGIEPSVEGMTCYACDEGEGYLYARDRSKVNADNSWSPREPLYMYTYPNPSERTFEEGVYDYTTKLVIEASLDGEVFWYPIPLPYTQPNWAYTVNSVTLTTRGSGDPNLPVTSKQVILDLTVRDWTTGEIIGSYNHPDGGSGFVF